MISGYDVKVELCEHTMVGAGPSAGNRTATLRYLPGSILRGALAQRWIVENGRPDTLGEAQRSRFAELFEGELSFGPCHATGASLRAVSELHRKYAGAGAEAVVDLARDPAPADRSGYEPGRGEIDGVRVVEVTRTELGPDERVRDGNLFSRQAIAAGTVLSGFIGGADAWLDDLCEQPLQIRVGGRRSVGGRAVVRITKAAVPPRPAQGSPIVVRALGPVIQVDVFNRPSSTFESTSMAAAIGVPSDQLRILDSWTRTEVVHGWHIASGFPKPDDLALAIGSTALVEVPPGTDVSPWEAFGVGLRTAEGFGRLIVDPPPRGITAERSAVASNSLAVDHFRHVRESWLGFEPKKVRDLLKDALGARSIGEIADSERLLGRGDGRQILPADRSLLDTIAALPTGELADLVVLVEAQLVESQLMDGGVR